MRQVVEWDFPPNVGDDSFGVYFPEDGYLTHHFVKQDEAENYLRTTSSTHPYTKGAYVVRVQIERVEES